MKQPTRCSQTLAGFLIMAALAKGLPVCLIPEQSLISPMRNDMVHDGSRGELSLPHTLSTQGVQLQEDIPLPSPPGIVPAGIGSAPKTVTAPHDMIPAEDLPRNTKARAAGIPARPRRCMRHCLLLLHQSKVSISRTS